MRFYRLIAATLLVTWSSACGSNDASSGNTDSGPEQGDAAAAAADGAGADDAAADASAVDGGAGDAAADSGSAADAEAGPAPFPAPHPEPPHVVTVGGPVLANPKLVPVFFSNDNPTTVSQLGDFTQKIGTTNYWAALSEYGVGAATALPSVSLTETAPATIDDSAIQTWLAGKLNGNDPAWPAPDANTVYVLYYPASTTITMSGAASCQAFGGYHFNIQLDGAHANLSVSYVVVPNCGSFGNLAGIDALTGAASHELVESATDPYPMTTPAYATVDNADIYWQLTLGGGEVGDMCAQFPDSFTKFADLSYTVQRFWSNASAHAGHSPCAPPLPGAIYFNSAPVLPDMVPITLYGQSVTIKSVKIPVGQSRTIDVDLFSDAATTGPWTVKALDATSLISGGSPQLSFSFDHTTGANGDVLKLTISALAASKNGGSAFVVESSLGGTTSFWVGTVTN